MCQTCWQDRGSPNIVNENVQTVVRIIGEVYKFALTGGNLHIVLDDWNIEDSDLEFCKEAIEQEAISRPSASTPSPHQRNWIRNGGA